LGVASYDQAKSALIHLYRMSKHDIPSDFADNLKIFMKVMKRTVAAKKMEDGDSGIVGKKKMDFKVYEMICELFLKEEGEEYLFARCFLILDWNLMSRSDNIVHAHLFHITWEDDCLVFHFAKAKWTRQGGTVIRCDMFMPRPTLAPFLAFPLTSETLNCLTLTIHL
jgi:hypothetical protein